MPASSQPADQQRGGSEAQRGHHPKSRGAGLEEAGWREFSRPIWGRAVFAVLIVCSSILAVWAFVDSAEEDGVEHWWQLLVAGLVVWPCAVLFLYGLTAVARLDRFGLHLRRVRIKHYGWPDMISAELIDESPIGCYPRLVIHLRDGSDVEIDDFALSTRRRERLLAAINVGVFDPSIRPSGVAPPLRVVRYALLGGLTAAVTFEACALITLWRGYAG